MSFINSDNDLDNIEKLSDIVLSDNISSDTELRSDNEQDFIETNELVFNPYNSINREITIEEVESILNRYGIYSKPNNIKLYKRAFVHVSYTRRPNAENLESNIIISDKPDNCLPLKTKSNERLEFIGDGVLECITKYYLYRRFPKADEGFMTEKKIALVKNEHIGKLALQMRLNKWFIISRHAEEKNTRNNLKKLGCLFEAFLGALFLDFNKIEISDEEGWFKNVFVNGPGFQMAQIFVEKIYEAHVDWIELIKTDDNYKNILQVKIQKEFKTTPDYVELSRSDLGYEMGVYISLGKPIHEFNIQDAIDYSSLNSFQKIQDLYLERNSLLIFLSKSRHKIKKKAEQSACHDAIQKIANSNI
jgi:dsRNA-specific ribonuclease